jgi:PAS domain-containing protein
MMEETAQQCLEKRTREAIAVRNTALAAGVLAPVLTAALLMSLAGATRRALSVVRLDAADRISSALKLPETVIGSIADAIIATDAQGYVTRMNPAATVLTGIDSTAAIGKHIGAVAPLRRG